MRTGIYKLVWGSGHYYIGKSSDIDRRYMEHIRNLERLKHSNIRVSRCYKKHGKPVLELIELCDEDLAYKVERIYLDKSRQDCKLCLNFKINDITGETEPCMLQGRRRTKHNGIKQKTPVRLNTLPKIRTKVLKLDCHVYDYYYAKSKENNIDLITYIEGILTDLYEQMNSTIQ